MTRVLCCVALCCAIGASCPGVVGGSCRGISDCEFFVAIRLRGSLPGLARKVGSASRGPAVLLRNFKSFAAALHARLALRDGGDTSKHSKEDLINVGRRLTALDFVSFVCLFTDSMASIVQPWALSVQSNAMEPWVLSLIYRARLVKVEQLAGALFWYRGFLRVITLLRQHSPLEDIQNLVRAYCCMPPRHTSSPRAPTVPTSVGGGSFLPSPCR